MLPAIVPLLDQHDRPLQSLRLSVTDRCNLRCRYCMPADGYVWLPRSEVLSFDELRRLVRAFVGVGVRRLRLTGGEPLLRRGLPTLIAMLAEGTGVDDLALTTNGMLLERHARALRDAGLGRLTVSLDTLRPDRFKALTRADGLAKVLRGIDTAIASGFDPLKLDTVVMRGFNDDELEDLLRYAQRVGAELRFIEYMDVGGATSWSAEQTLSADGMLATITERLGAPEALPGRGAAPAQRYRLPSGQTFGIIASTTAPFCGGCTRSRLTADGMWYPCLYAEQGTDLKTPLRAPSSDAELRAIIERLWTCRDDRGAEQRARRPDDRGPLPREALEADSHLEMHTRGG